MGMLISYKETTKLNDRKLKEGCLPQDHYNNKHSTEPNANNFIFGTTIQEVCSPQDPTKRPLS
jgi:hypothetical protein